VNKDEYILWFFGVTTEYFPRWNKWC